MVDAYHAGDPVTARALHLQLMPVFVGLFRTQAAILTKAALGLLGLPGGTVRPPLVEATEGQLATLREDLAAAGVALP
jgi:4-hydroxy-tetrahydrodipicolinate synthase